MPDSGRIRRILLVEDEESDAALVTLHIRRAQALARVEIVRASTLAEALGQLEHGSFDCVILDLGLPDGHGLENVQRIRAASAGVAIVVLTGQDDNQMAVAALRYGAQEYLVKGRYEDGALFRVLRHAVERHGVLVEIDRQRERDIFMAGHDPLTGLFNRQLLAQRAGEVIALCERRGESFALCFLDLDGFKPVNDRYGHAVGDAALKQVAAALLGAARSTDMVARVGGDEFVVLLYPVTGAAEAERAAARLVQRIGEISVVEGYAVSIGASGGLAIYPQHGRSLEQLFLCADHAMYAAKEGGRGILKVSAEGRDRDARGAVEHLVDDANLALLYQPWIDPATGRFGGCEALLRQRLGGDLVPPDGILRTALDAGLLGNLCQWVVRKASQQWKAWHDAGLPVGRLAINVTRAELGRPDLPSLVLGILHGTGMPARFLQIELPEDSFDLLAPEALENIRTLRAYGVQIVMDSFGRSIGGLRHLLNQPVDALKIDRSLVHTLGTASAGEQAMLAAVFAVARSQNLPVTAMGVEDEAQLERCKTLGARYVQGNHLVPPLTAAQLEARLLPAGARPRLELVRGGRPQG
ncbi:MAG TPA: EAL domain-containing protein [Nevskia sp.]|nr:EAL domain-containing protein [Nevskia sp.]